MQMTYIYSKNISQMGIFKEELHVFMYVLKKSK